MLRLAWSSGESIVLSILPQNLPYVIHVYLPLLPAVILPVWFIKQSCHERRFVGAITLASVCVGLNRKAEALERL